MSRQPAQRAFLAAVILAVAIPASAKTVTLTVTKPTNVQDKKVKVIVNPGPDVEVTIPAGTSAQEKRNLIRDALDDAGYDVENGAEANQLKIKYLKQGTKVIFRPNGTGEERDELVAMAIGQADVGFADFFDPFDYEGQPAVFLAGFATDAGELVAQVSAAELDFRTDGAYICQVLGEQLAWQAPYYGVEVVCNGNQLEFYFDMTMTQEHGAVIFGTTSPSAGCTGGLVLGEQENGPDGGDADSRVEPTAIQAPQP